MIGVEKNVLAFNTGLRELYPIFCGYEDCRSGHKFGPAVREYYLIHFVRSGKGIFSQGKKEYRLSPGQCFLIRPDEITCYRADETDPWHYVWIAFSGEFASSFLDSAGLENRCVFENDRIAGLFEELYHQIDGCMLDIRQNEFAMLSVLYAIFAALPQKTLLTEPGEQYVLKVENYVSKTISDPISVQSLADYCGLERHYLCRVFKRRTGRTLQEYALDCKMRRARELLLSSALSIGDVSRSVGYEDVYNFSKMFKKRFGLAPKRLRDLYLQDHAAGTPASCAP